MRGEQLTVDRSDVIGKTVLDKNSLYGEYLKGASRKSRMEDKAIAKALDIPLDDEVNINQTSFGLSGWHLVALAGILGYLLLQGHIYPPSALQSPRSEVSPPGISVPDVQVDLWYNDPELGLVPIPGAAGPDGGDVPYP